MRKTNHRCELNVSGLGKISWGQVECDWRLPLHHPHLQHQHLCRPLCSLPLLLCHQGASAALWPGPEVLLCQGSYFPFLLARGCPEHNGGVCLMPMSTVQFTFEFHFRQVEWFSPSWVMTEPTRQNQEQFQLAIRIFSSALRCSSLLWLWSELEEGEGPFKKEQWNLEYGW